MHQHLDLLNLKFFVHEINIIINLIARVDSDLINLNPLSIFFMISIQDIIGFLHPFSEILNWPWLAQISKTCLDLVEKQFVHLLLVRMNSRGLFSI